MVPGEKAKNHPDFQPARNEFYDITRQVEAIVYGSGVKAGMMTVHIQGVTAGIMV